MSTPEFHTERLVLRPLRAADLPAFVAYRRDPDVARYQSWDVDYSMADAERLLEEHAGIALGQPGVWVQTALADRADGSLLGDCASRVLTGAPATAEIGITLPVSSQGRGLAREAVRGLVSRLFGWHRIQRVVAEADDRNRPVQRVFEGLGFHLEARLVDAEWFKGEWVTLRIYAVDHDGWPEH